MKLGFRIALICSLFLASCNNEPTLQKYFVENAENKDFIALDVSPNMLNVDKIKLSLNESNALQSFDKINLLAFKSNGKNQVQFESERTKVVSLLKNKKYQQLMKVGSGKEGATISYVGSDEHIEEFVLFANKKETGFAVVRILGKDMNPSNIMAMLQVLQKSNIDLEQLKPLQGLVK